MIYLESRHDANFVVTGDTGGCHSNNPQIVAMATIGATSDDKSCQNEDDSRFSAGWMQWIMKIMVDKA